MIIHRIHNLPDTLSLPDVTSGAGVSPEDTTDEAAAGIEKVSHRASAGRGAAVAPSPTYCEMWITSRTTG